MDHPVTRQLLLLCIGICLFVLLFLLTLLFLPQFISVPPESVPSSPAGHPDSSAGTLPSATETAAATAPGFVFDGSIQTEADGMPSFSMALSQFIACYNGRYTPPMGTDARWRSHTEAVAPYTGAGSTLWVYQADPSVLTYPVVQVYTQPDQGRILEVSLPLSQHDWTENLEQIYGRQARKVLSLFLPEAADQQVQALYRTLFEDAHGNVYISHSDAPRPKTVRIVGQAGFYGYIYRGMICINIIPINSEMLSALARQGITIEHITT